MSDLPMRDSRIPSRTSQDGNLRDALATALNTHWLTVADGSACCTCGVVIYPGGTKTLDELLALPDPEFAFTQHTVDAALADPAFRAALTDAIAEALAGEDDEDFGYPAGWTHDEFAAAIVARMLGGGRE